MKIVTRFKEFWLTRDSRDVLIITFIFGLVAHGFVFFNKFGWYDELSLGFKMDPRLVISLGRWTRGMIGWLIAKVTGGTNLTPPLFHGCISILFIYASAYLIIRLFNIQGKMHRILLCGMMVTFPAVTATFGYMFTAPYYFFALFLATLGVYLVVRIGGWKGFIPAAICICFCIGIYQAYISIAVSLMVLVLIFGLVNRKSTWLETILKGFYSLGVCIAGFLSYYAIWKTLLKVLNIEAGSYQGINAVGNLGIKEYWEGVVRAYKTFFLAYDKESSIVLGENLYENRVQILQVIVLVLSILVAVILLIRQFRKHKGEAVVLLGLISILPLCFNVIYLISSNQKASIHSLMLYGQVMLYVFLICGVQAIEASGFKPYKAIAVCSLAILSLLAFSNTYTNNTYYLKAAMLKEQMISEETQLVARIKGLPGYTADMGVCIIYQAKADATRTSNAEFENMHLLPYSTKLMDARDSRNLVNGLNRWCGFSPKYVSASKFNKLDEVKEMPVFPSDGSVKIIDGVVVVKWGTK